VDKIIEGLRQKIAQAEAKERELNVHLGYAPDKACGSLAVSVRWDTLAKVVDEVERLRGALLKVEAENARLRDLQERGVKAFAEQLAETVITLSDREQEGKG